jgi:hypothetical protein
MNTHAYTTLMSTSERLNRLILRLTKSVTKNVLLSMRISHTTERIINSKYNTHVKYGIRTYWIGSTTKNLTNWDRPSLPGLFNLNAFFYQSIWTEGDSALLKQALNSFLWSSVLPADESAVSDFVCLNKMKILCRVLDSYLFSLGKFVGCIKTILRDHNNYDISCYDLFYH